MKNLLIGLVSAFLLATGLVATAGSANAATVCPAYTGCVKTKTTVIAPKYIRRNQIISVTTKVAPLSGTGSPRGTIIVRCSKSGVVKQLRRAYLGSPVTVKWRLGTRGKWTCSSWFGSGYKWLPSRGSTVVTVTR